MTAATMTEKKKAEMKFRLALKKEAEGEPGDVDKWLNAAAEHELAAIENGEGSPEI